MICMSEVGQKHKRTVTKVLDRVSTFGGLFYLIRGAAVALYLGLGWPFRDINFAISSNKLIEKVTQHFPDRLKSKRIDKQLKIQVMYEKKLTACFYMKYWTYSMLKKVGLGFLMISQV